jgi:hypothetical protein
MPTLPRNKNCVASFFLKTACYDRVVSRAQVLGGWWQRNWGWCCGCGCLLPLFAIGAVALGTYWFGNRLVMSNDAIDSALELLNRDPRAVEALGEPIEPRFWRENTSINFGGRGKLRARFGVAGPRGEGRLEIEAHRKDGDGPWRLDVVRLHLRDHDTALDLLDEIKGRNVPDRIPDAVIFNDA